MAQPQSLSSTSNHYQAALRAVPSASAPTLTQTTPSTSAPRPQQAVLRLRGANVDQRELMEETGEEGRTKRRTMIQWAEDVVDNEGLGRKKSKVCCIYHAPKGIDESSDESSSDSDDSDSDADDDGSARPSKSGRKDCDGHDHAHDHPHDKRHGRPKKSSPNAYERIPKPRKNGGTAEQR